MSIPSYGDSASIALGGGYGDSASIELSLGYGDPPGALGLSPVVEGQETFSDYGGELVTITGDFGPGPYYIRLLDGGGGLAPSVGFAWSGVPGQGAACYPWQVGDTLQFILPATEPGVYQVRVYLDDQTTYVDSVNTIEVKRRVYAQATYRWRGSFPGRWLGPGPRRVRDEHEA